MSIRLRAGALLAFVAAGAILFGTSSASAQTAPCGGKVASGETAGDPCGDNTGNMGNVVVDKDGNGVTKAPDSYDPAVTQQVADATGKNKIGLNFTWTLMTGFLVMFMQAGFALVETG